MTTMLLAQDFPPMGGGIARLHGELAQRFPKGELIVSTPSDPDAAEVDAGLPAIIDRLPMGVRHTKTLPGVLFWSRRAASLARQHKVRFVHCGNVKPAGYPARWVYERQRIPYGIFFHGADLLSEQHKIRHSRLKRRTARAIFGGAAVLMANSGWTRDLALSLLGDLGLDGHGQRLRIVHLGTDPTHFRPSVDPRALRERFELPDEGTRWIVTVARLQKHKGMDTVIEALPAILARATPLSAPAPIGSGWKSWPSAVASPTVYASSAASTTRRCRRSTVWGRCTWARRVAPSGSAWKASAFRSSRLPRAACRSSRATRAAFQTPCATARPASWYRPRSRRPSPTRSVVCSRILRPRSAWGRMAAARWRRISIGIAWCATSGRSRRRL